MRKILIFAICLLLPIFWTTAANADSSQASTITDININAGSKTEFTSESKAQPPSVQELNFLHPMSLFVYAEDYRNIMTVIKFIYEHPAPHRWELEKWARGSSSEITISSLNDEVNSKSPNDQILFTLDADLVKFTLDATGKKIAEAVHKGSGTGNTTSSKIISVQNLCKFTLAAMNRGHNIFEVKAQIIASRVEGSAGGFALGGGMSNVNNGGTAVSIPAIIGWAKGKAGKIGLEGIQAELYYKTVISFEEDAAKTRKQIEEIWKKQKEAAKEKEDMDKLRLEAEKEKLQFEKKKYELEKEKATRELNAMKPQPKAEVAPTKPPAEKCEAEKQKIAELEKDRDMLEKMAKDAAKERETAEKEKEEALNPPVCNVSLEFPFNRWMPTEAEKREKIPKIADWLAQNWNEAKKRKMKWMAIGHADERGPLPIQADRINPFLGEWRARWLVALVSEELITNHGFAKEQIKELFWAGAGKSFPVVLDAKTEVEHQKNRQAYIVLVAPGVKGYNTK